MKLHNSEHIKPAVEKVSSIRLRPNAGMLKVGYVEGPFEKTGFANLADRKVIPPISLRRTFQR